MSAITIVILVFVGSAMVFITTMAFVKARQKKKSKDNNNDPRTGM